MANFSLGSERHHLEMKVAITWRFPSGLKLLAQFQKFSPSKGAAKFAKTTSTVFS